MSCGVQLTKDKVGLSSSGKYEGDNFAFSGTTTIGNPSEAGSYLWQWSFEILNGGTTIVCETVTGTATAPAQFSNPSACSNYTISGQNQNPVITPSSSVSGQIDIEYTLTLSDPENEEEPITVGGSVSGGSSGGGPAPSIPITPWIVQTGTGAFGSSLPGGDTTKGESCYELRVDSIGNIYCAGITWGGSLGEINGGSSDAFIMKLDPNGNLLWIKQMGAGSFGAALPGGDTSGGEYCSQFLIDSHGDVYCSGSTNGSLGESNGGLSDIFIMKLSSLGDLLWIKQTGSGSFGSSLPGGTPIRETCHYLKLDSLDNVYCAGEVEGSFGESGGGQEDIFVMKLDPFGNLIWIKQAGSGSFGSSFPGGDTSRSDRLHGFEIDSNDNLYLAGGTFGSLGEVNGGDSDAFIIKLSSLGSLLWVKQTGAGAFGSTLPGGDTTKNDFCEWLDLDINGNVYCTGETRGSLGESIGGAWDIFIMKLDSLGNLVWVKQAGTGTFGASFPGGDLTGLDCYSTKIDINNNFFCAGITQGASAESSGGGDDAIVMKLDPMGNLLWVKQTGSGLFGSTLPGGSSSGDELCMDLQLDSSGNAYCLGGTTSSLGEINGGGSDMFIMKLNLLGNLEWIKQTGAGSFGSALPGGDTSLNEYGHILRIDSVGNTYSTGQTYGSLGEIFGGGPKGELFIMKLDPNGNL